MKRRLGKFSILFWLCLSCLAVAAQDTPNSQPPNDLVLEVTFFQGRQPALQKIGGNERVRANAWYSLFRRIDGFQPKAGEFPVRAVNLVPYFEKDGAVKVRVSVFTGEKFHDEEVFVADVSLRENERKTIGELTKFGVQPFELAVVQSVRGAADLPAVINKTTALQVFVEPEVSELPRFKVKLLNTSNKPVAAVSLETSTSVRRLISGMPQGREGRSLIAPGETYETSMPNNSAAIKDEAGLSLSLVVGAVVFTDGTYEGEPLRAALFRSFDIGRRSFLRRAVPLWQRAAEGKKPSESLNELTSAIAAINTTPGESELSQLFGQFPDLSAQERSDRTDGVEAALRSAKKSMLDELEKFAQNPNKTDESVRLWLKAATERYQNWLARLAP